MSNPKIENLKKIISSSSSLADSTVDPYIEEVKDLDNDRKKLLTQGLKDYLATRKDFAYKIYRLVVVWLVFIGLAVVLSGVGLLKFSDAVLISLISSTTVNICAFLVIVANFLFPKTDKDILDKLG